jgi:hypothetical protein
LILLLVNTFPLLYSCYISVTNYSLSDPDTSSFVCLNNFVIAFRDQMFLNSLLMTAKSTLGSVFCEFSLGLLIAVLLNRLNKSGNLVLGIGGGPAGITAATAASSFGKSVALVDSHQEIGGASGPAHCAIREVMSQYAGMRTAFHAASTRAPGWFVCRCCFS